MTIKILIGFCIAGALLTGCSNFDSKDEQAAKKATKRLQELTDTLNFYRSKKVVILEAKLKQKLPIERYFNKKIIISREQDKKINKILGKPSYSSGYGIIKLDWVFDDGTILTTDSRKEPKDSRGYYRYHYCWLKLKMHKKK